MSYELHEEVLEFMFLHVLKQVYFFYFSCSGERCDTGFAEKLQKKTFLDRESFTSLSTATR